MAQSRIGSVDGRCSPSEHNVGKTLWGRRFHRQAGKVPLPTDSLSKARSETAGTVVQLNSGIQVCAPSAFAENNIAARCGQWHVLECVGQRGRLLDLWERTPQSNGQMRPGTL